MKIKPAKTADDREVFDAGLYGAHITAFIDLGIQPNTFDESQPDQHKCAIAFELDLTYEHDGETKPVVVWSEFTVSNNERAKLRSVLDACGCDTTKEVDTKDLLGKSVGLVTKHNKNQYLVYSSASPLGKLSVGEATLKPFEADVQSECPAGFVPSWIRDRLPVGELSEEESSMPF